MGNRFLLLYMYLFLVFALVSLAMWLRRQKRRRSSAAVLPMSKCRSAAQGYVRLFGKQRYLPDGPLHAPWTGKPCTSWRCSIMERRTLPREQGGGTEWVEIYQQASASLLVLDDGTGQVLVNSAGVPQINPVNTSLMIGRGDSWRGDDSFPRLPPVGDLPDGRYRYMELRMDEGDPIYVAGRLTTFSAVPSAEGARQATLQLLNKWKGNQTELLARFDENHDGVIDMAEWEKARLAAAEQAEAQLSRAQMAAVSGWSVVARPANGEPFVVSPLFPVDDDNLKYQSRPEFFLFVVFSLVALWIWSKI